MVRLPPLRMWFWMLTAYRVGLTETSTVVCTTHPTDIYLGSSGSLIPGIEVRILTPEGNEVTTYDTPGELVVKSPSVVLGYLNNEKATKETFENGWMRTGDEAVIRLSPKGFEHIFIVDRIKELIKVKVCTFCRQTLSDSPVTDRIVLGSASRTRRTRSPPPHSSRRGGLRRHRHPR